MILKSPANGHYPRHTADLSLWISDDPRPGNCVGLEYDHGSGTFRVFLTLEELAALAANIAKIQAKASDQTEDSGQTEDSALPNSQTEI